MSRPRLAHGTAAAQHSVDHASIGAPVNGLPRVLIADDHVPTRARVIMVLERSGFEVCAQAGNAEAAVDAALRERPDVCLLDVHMPGSGIAAAKEIRARLAAAVVIMLTVSHEPSDLADSRRAGANGYLLKDMDPARLPDAVRAALGGDAVFPDVP